jgi:hypothetical protein
MRMVVGLLLVFLLAIGGELTVFGVPDAVGQSSSSVGTGHGGGRTPAKVAPASPASQRMARLSVKLRREPSNCCGSRTCSICCPAGRTAVCRAGGGSSCSCSAKAH